MTEIPRPIGRLLANKAHYNSETDGTPPSNGHYKDRYFWDSGIIAYVYADHGFPEHAETEVRAMLKGQDPETGFIPNMCVIPGNGRSLAHWKRKIDLERYTFPNENSGYSQPNLTAWAAKETHDSYLAQGREDEGRQFLQESFDQIEKSYLYFMTYRQDNPRSRLVNVIYPHETGRDSDPTFDFAKLRLPRLKGNLSYLTDIPNTVLDYGSALNINRKLQKIGWDEARARDIFWVKDVMFNCLYAQNLSVLSDIAGILGKDEEKQAYRSISGAVNAEILTKMWDPEDQKFYALNKNDQIKTVSVSNLFPIILSDISREQMESILDMMRDPQWFGTEYPIPSVPVNSPHFDPDYREKRIWRGGTWMNMNLFLTEGLIAQRDRFASEDPALAQRCNTQALIIAQKSAELVDREGYWEFYHPHTGKGQRVKEFSWSTSGDVLKGYIENLRRFALPKEIIIYPSSQAADD